MSESDEAQIVACDDEPFEDMISETSGSCMEFFLARDQALKRFACKVAMADLAAPGPRKLPISPTENGGKL